MRLNASYMSENKVQRFYFTKSNYFRMSGNKKWSDQVLKIGAYLSSELTENVYFRRPPT